MFSLKNFCGGVKLINHESVHASIARLYHITLFTPRFSSLNPLLTPFEATFLWFLIMTKLNERLARFRYLFTHIYHYYYPTSNFLVHYCFQHSKPNRVVINNPASLSKVHIKYLANERLRSIRPYLTNPFIIIILEYLFQHFIWQILSEIWFKKI